MLHEYSYKKLIGKGPFKLKNLSLGDSHDSVEVQLNEYTQGYLALHDIGDVSIPETVYPIRPKAVYYQKIPCKPGVELVYYLLVLGRSFDRNMFKSYLAAEFGKPSINQKDIIKMAGVVGHASFGS